MNHKPSSSEIRRPRFDWREDLSRSRDLTQREIEGYGYVLGWIEDWRAKKDLPAGRDAARAWWREVAKGKERPGWQLRQWEEAIRWYLSWLEICLRKGGDGKSVPERLKEAIHHAGARRGLALKTRQTYAGWLARFAVQDHFCRNDAHRAPRQAIHGRSALLPTRLRGGGDSWVLRVVTNAATRSEVG